MVSFISSILRYAKTRIWCPPGGACVSGDLNRLKFVEAPGSAAMIHDTWQLANCIDCPISQAPNSAVSRATWDPRNLCRDERNATMAPGDGGQRVDFKLWAAERVMLGRQSQAQKPD